MTGSMLLTALMEMTNEFFAQGETAVYVAVGADRLYIGVEPAKGIRGSTRTPENRCVQPGDDLEAVAQWAAGLLGLS